jgi:elongation factor P--(R)-beta-lysine ligase
VTNQVESELRSRIIARSKIFRQIRSFFSQKNILEVDTSLVRAYSVTDPYMNAFSVHSPNGEREGYLQTSPEFAMKKLIAQGAGDIYQLSKMFRAYENGPHHSTEFTLLEWYRMGFSSERLTEEVTELICLIVGVREIVRKTYQECFLSVLGIDPFTISEQQLADYCRGVLTEIPTDLLFDNYLSLLFSEKIEKSFDPNAITVVFDYPESQASLSKLKTKGEQVVGDRFEIYLAGLELANGFNELTDACEQRARFEQDNMIRLELGLAPISIDESFIEGLEMGLPACSGVALGIDRLLMIEQAVEDIKDVLTGIDKD